MKSYLCSDRPVYEHYPQKSQVQHCSTFTFTDLGVILHPNSIKFHV